MTYVISNCLCVYYVLPVNGIREAANPALTPCYYAVIVILVEGADSYGILDHFLISSSFKRFRDVPIDTSTSSPIVHCRFNSLVHFYSIASQLLRNANLAALTDDGRPTSVLSLALASNPEAHLLPLELCKVPLAVLQTFPTRSPDIRLRKHLLALHIALSLSIADLG